MTGQADKPRGETSGRAPCWELERQDDNGNTFSVARFATEDEAQAAAAAFAAKAHKQTYAVRRIVPGD